MEIVILDGYTTNPGDLSWDALRAFGSLTVYDRTATADVEKRIGNAEIVYMNKTVLPEDIFDRCPSVRFLGLLSTGYNLVNLAYAKEKGVTVCNIPAYSTASVAQLTISLLLEICFRVGDHSRAVQDGAWVRSKDFCFWNAPLLELAGKTMGIVGFGAIGQSVAEIAAALGMQVLYTNRRCAPLPGSRYTYTDLDTLLRRSDVLSLHAPLTPETENLIRKENIEKMKDGCILLNTSRGGAVCEADLRAALDSGKIRAAGLDVCAQEPMQATSPLLGAPNCFITPHIAWATPEARTRLVSIATENLKCFLAGTPINVVNP